MPEKMRTRPTNLVDPSVSEGRGSAARETLGAWGAIPRRGLPSDAPRNPALGGEGRKPRRSAVAPRCPIAGDLCMARGFVDRRSFAAVAGRVAVSGDPLRLLPRRP